MILIIRFINMLTKMRRITFATLEAKIQGEVLLPIPDPYSKIYLDKDLTSKQIEKRTAYWQVASGHWEVYKEQLLERKIRENAFVAIENETNLSKLKIKSIFNLKSPQL